MATTGIYNLEAANNNLQINEFSIINKFGRNASVGTSFVPICYGGIYRTPQVGSATKLRVKAGNANDTAAGTGAREITLQGLNASGVEVTETLATAGASPSSNTTNDFIRLYRAYVSKSGTYATQSAGSHAADIVIENAAGTEDWLTIDVTNFPHAQSEVGAYTIPLGKEGYITQIEYTLSTSKTVNIFGFQRQKILDTAAPYQAMRIFYTSSVFDSSNTRRYNNFIGPFPELTDVGFLAKVSATTAEVNVSFSLLLRDV